MQKIYSLSRGDGGGSDGDDSDGSWLLAQLRALSVNREYRDRSSGILLNVAKRAELLQIRVRLLLGTLVRMGGENTGGTSVSRRPRRGPRLFLAVGGPTTARSRKLQLLPLPLIT